jgi:hypothetical protein
MLKANVGLSRKITLDYNSTGYSVNLDAEIAAVTDEPESILERIHELYDLAEEALNQEIDRDQGDQAIGRRDEEPQVPPQAPTQKPTDPPNQPPNGAAPAQKPPSPSGSQPRSDKADAATNKQVQFLLTMGKRLKLSTPQLDKRVADIIGRPCGVYKLTKKEAGLVLDTLTNSTNGNGRQTQERA